MSPDLSPKWFGTGWDALGPKFRQKSVIPDDFGTPWDLTEPLGLGKNGEGGIRTHGGFHLAGFQDQSHQPLDHLSLSVIMITTFILAR